MIIFILILIFTATAFTTCLAINPLTLGILILYIALVLSLTFSSSISSWVALLIFLIYIGGMLVIFSYFVAITPNQSLYIYTVISIIILSSLLLLLISYTCSISPSTNIEYSKQANIIYETFNVRILIALALILLFSIVVVVKVSTHNKGPLRPFFKYV